MPGAYKRGTDKARGKEGRYTCWWVGEDGERRTCAGTTDRAGSLKIAHQREAEARAVREGIVEPGERRRREAALKPVADHVEEYRKHLLAKGGTAKHAAHVAGALTRLFASAGIASIAEMPLDAVQGALGRLRASASARTANHALGSFRAFARWLEDDGRVKDAPKGLRGLALYNEGADRRRVRRPLSPAELEKLVAATEAGRPIEAWPRRSKHLARSISGPDRAALYRLAMGTGFRDAELRSLTPESFRLDGDAPAVVCAAAYTKNGKEAVQPIRLDLAASLADWLEGKPPGVRLFDLPWSAARMLRVDLEAAGIPYRDPAGRLVDFHALRHSFITNLIKEGRNPKAVQKLARHSTITLTLDRYTTLDEGDLRAALEGENP